MRGLEEERREHEARRQALERERGEQAVSQCVSALPSLALLATLCLLPAACCLLSVVCYQFLLSDIAV